MTNTEKLEKLKVQCDELLPTRTKVRRNVAGVDVGVGVQSNTGDRLNLLQPRKAAFGVTKSSGCFCTRTYRNYDD